MRFLRNLLRQAGFLRRQAVTAGGDDGILAAMLGSAGLSVTFNMLEIGALPIAGASEPFHQLLRIFPSSRLAGLELDVHLCEKLNRTAPANIRYYPCALGRTAESRSLYETADPMCASLYRPDERYADLFNNLDVTRLQRISELETISLDQFVRVHELGEIDFIKIDIQGAELEVFQGGTEVLRNLLLIVCEVEFVPMYENQPLFGEVDAFLRGHGFMFHKFLGMAGRVMKPLMAHGSPNYPAQNLWADAAFVRDLFAFDNMSSERLLKSAVLLDLYDSKDVALYALRYYDAQEHTDLAARYLRRLNEGGPWRSLSPDRAVT